MPFISTSFKKIIVKQCIWAEHCIDRWLGFNVARLGLVCLPLSPDTAVILSLVWCLPCREGAGCSQTQHDDKIFYLCFMKDPLKMDTLDNLRSMKHPFLMFLAPRASNLLQMQTAAHGLQTKCCRVSWHPQACRVWPTLWLITLILATRSITLSGLSTIKTLKFELI